MIDDIFLQINAMVFAATAYTRNGGDPTKNCFLSPIYTPGFILKKLPPVRMLVCEVDPTRDMGVYFALQLKRAGVNTKLYFMRDYNHAFL